MNVLFKVGDLLKKVDLIDLLFNKFTSKNKHVANIGMVLVHMHLKGLIRMQFVHTTLYVLGFLDIHYAQ